MKQKFVTISSYYRNDFSELIEKEVEKKNKKGFHLVHFDIHNVVGNEGDCVGFFLFEKEEV